MVAISNRKSILTIKKESVKGEIEASTKADATAIQDGFEMSAEFGELESEELSGSLGAAKGDIGAEAPTASLSHYMRGSGVEGEEVDFGLLLEGALGGKTAAPAVEPTTTAGSTTEVLKTAGAFERGQAVLVKDGANGFNVRNILSVAGMDKSLAQILKTAPATGVKLGRPVLYKPNDEYPAFTLNLLRGDGGAREVMTEGYITEASLEATAREYFNGSFSFAGRGYFFNPVIVLGSETFEVDTDEVTLRKGQYKDPHDFAAMVQSVIRGAGNDKDETVTYDDKTGKFTIKANAAFQVDFSGAGQDAAGKLLGFGATDNSAATEYTSPNAINLSLDGALDYDPQGPVVAKNVEILLGDKEDTECFNASSMTATITNTRAESLDMCSESGGGESRISERVIEIEMSALLQKYDVDKFRRFREGESTMFTANFGSKRGGNWEPGKVVNLFSPTAAIKSFGISDADGLAQLDITLRCYSQDGLGEFYVNTL